MKKRVQENMLGWFEIHAENYMIDGGPVRNQLQQLRRDYPIVSWCRTIDRLGTGPGSVAPFTLENAAGLAGTRCVLRASGVVQSWGQLL